MLFQCKNRIKLAIFVKIRKTLLEILHTPLDSITKYCKLKELACFENILPSFVGD